MAIVHRYETLHNYMLYIDLYQKGRKIAFHLSIYLHLYMKKIL